MFIPWTAVNLVDYYIVRRGHYAIAEIFNPHGMYGRWGWRGILAYLDRLRRHDAVLQRRHAVRGRRGQGARRRGHLVLHRAARSPAILYYVFARSIDVAAETRVAQAEMDELEVAAAEHELP